MMTPVPDAPPVVGARVARPAAPDSEAAETGGFGALVAGHLASLAGSGEDAGETPGTGERADAEDEIPAEIPPGVTAAPAAVAASDGRLGWEATFLPGGGPGVADAANEDAGEPAHSDDPCSAEPVAEAAVAIAGMPLLVPTVRPPAGGTAPPPDPDASVPADRAAAPDTVRLAMPGAAGGISAVLAADDAGPTPGPTPVPEGGAASGQLATSGPAATSAGTPPAARSAVGGAVTTQVFPTVPALVSRGEGTHSITLRLHPADLGEVRVTVSVRNGAVDVTLAADPATQEALRAGAGELRSLLDLAGSPTTQLVVRDLSTGPQPVAPGAASSAFQLPTGQTAADGGPPDRGHGGDTATGRHGRQDRSGSDTPQSRTSDLPESRATARLDLSL